MGQYYYPAVMHADGIDTLLAFDYDNGLKLTEHSYVGNQFVNAVITHILNNHPGEAVRVAWIGDYSDEEDLKVVSERFHDRKKLFDAAHKATEDESTRIKGIVADDGCDSVRIYNMDRREMIDVAAYRDNVIARRKAAGHNGGDHWEDGHPEYFVLHPLPLLTALGNGKGGGDYQGTNMELIGLWALDEIVIVREGEDAPEGNFTDLSEAFCFEEVR